MFGCYDGKQCAMVSKRPRSDASTQESHDEHENDSSDVSSVSLSDSDDETALWEPEDSKPMRRARCAESLERGRHVAQLFKPLEAL